MRVKTALAKPSRSEIAVGDTVVIHGAANWLRKGSDGLPWGAVPKSYQEASEIPLAVLPPEIFIKLMEASEVMFLSQDGQRVRVRSPDGRVTAFNVSDVSVLPETGKNHE